MVGLIVFSLENIRLENWNIKTTDNIGRRSSRNHIKGMSSPTPDSSAPLSDAKARAILMGWENLDPEHVELFVSSGVGQTLIRLARSGFLCSEGDPLPLVCPDPANYEAPMQSKI
ncbi:hypothetical protein PF005_g6328 [Phytophthora fragariae]|uniref:Uncharacterized protein n=1 Tax=Phytophthora fragariae TaxID=53985 RepID=A0A6A3FF27_9STRA|nr:hypothetical protein PF003_g21545 [Phytophthora fragariae]KAE8943216.1 hypothetical protein PF009_g7045 [Phytophthora fragariae]KAE9014218.1 hypothetical protein PF011_g8152 [Phytophthora fragariae]KAE9118678.1 hypothetical protein PF010_g8120 [Phytophthora fragariae]KAE9124639.1 hypothetical protein PF007_g6628 [Phytophthora fragariae]